MRVGGLTLGRFTPSRCHTTGRYVKCVCYTLDMPARALYPNGMPSDEHLSLEQVGTMIGASVGGVAGAGGDIRDIKEAMLRILHAEDFWIALDEEVRKKREGEGEARSPIRVLRLVPSPSDG